MRLAYKLTALLAVASAGPLLLATVVTLRSNRAALKTQLDTFHTNAAKNLAREVDFLVDSKLDDIGFVAKEVLSPEIAEKAPLRRKALELIYNQTRYANVVGLFDARLLPVQLPLFLRKDELDAERARSHDPIDDHALDVFANHVPVRETIRGGVPVVGPPYVVDDASGKPIPRVVLAVPTPSPGGRTWALVVEISLRELLDSLERQQLGEEVEAFIVDQQGRVIVHQDAELVRTRANLSQHPLLKGTVDGSTVVGAVESSTRTGWKVVVAQPAVVGFAALRKHSSIALIVAGFGLVVAFVLGFGMVRTVTRPLNELRAVSQDVASGKLDVRVDVRGHDELAELGDAFNAMTRGLEERERLKQTFSRYVSGQIADRILRESNDLELRGEQVRVTVLFADLRGFTSLSERHSPDEVMDLLNAYMEQVVEVVSAEKGVINKFIGDAVLAVFGAPQKIDAPETRAVRAALELSSRVAAFNQGRKRDGLEVAEFGIGVNTGTAVAGNLGGSQRLEYTVIGDAVNIAQRLQSMAAGGEVLISKETFDGMEPLFNVEACGRLKVKGRASEVASFRVVGYAPNLPARARPA